MDFLSVLEIIVVAICAITYGFMLFFKVRGNVLGAVSELIALAEASGLTGAEKMSQVVNGLYLKIPAPLKKIFTPERLQSIAQTIFDWMRKYADEYKANSEAGVVKTPEEVKTDVAVAAADLAIELLKLTVPELKKKAEEYGIKLDGLTRKDEILRAIMFKAPEFEPGENILYIPDTDLNDIPIAEHPTCEEEIEEIIDQCYTGNDFIEECDGNVEKAERLFWYCDWQHPSAALPEIENDEEDE